jgi:inhibitor of KinA sporulation pathway (predicted exonuclease)
MKINVIDLEATCEKNKSENFVSEIIEIGIAQIDLKSLTICKYEGVIIKPEHSKISTFCEELTTISQHQVDTEGISLYNALQYLKKEYQTKKYPMAAYGLYDKQMLMKDCTNKGLEYTFNYNYYNIKNLICLFYNFPKECGLSKCLDKFSIDFKGTHHRGKDDAYNTAILLLEKILKPFYERLSF